MRRIGTPLERVPDEALLAGLMTGDPEIAVAFVRRFQCRVFGMAVAVIGDTRLAEDIAQQTFERACRYAQAYDPRRGSVAIWLATIAHNLAIDTVRARRATPVDPGDLESMVESVTGTPEQHALAAETTAELRRAVATLPREQARALVLARIHGMTAQQIADFERVPLGTAKTRIRAAMGKLRAFLETRQLDHD
ncbi:sigma-70 family RNA polymerase sigma factor [Kitasatospora sp. GP82]|uniref:RNA polymerase sigma factor n=1 Tax=Kitasatospora sp. GP82 TaxID=3035089 RepID=UPI002477028A|nr:sigma-70 family RNA polymerase sigma factor [Kitasatospora sp. GP82]MDH6125440.1 RNA polymerase sigma factor (sigma-70 family) [Kitasatospora sp. GP82]